MTSTWMKRGGFGKGNDAPTPDQEPAESNKDDKVPALDRGELSKALESPDEKNKVEDKEQKPKIKDDRGIPSINQSSRLRTSALIPVIGLVVVVGGIWLIPTPTETIREQASNVRTSEAVYESAPANSAAILPPANGVAPQYDETVASVPVVPGPATQAPTLTSRSLTPLQIIPAPQPIPGNYPSGASQQVPLTPLERRKRSKQLIHTSEANQQAAVVTASHVGTPNGPGVGSFVSSTSPAESGLTQQLKPSVLNGVSASMQANRSLLISQGRSLACVLDVAISSSVPGLVMCSLTRDAYADDGSTVLLERGTVLTGEQRGGMQTGQKRLFVLWNRARTPHGVVVDLASPGSDSLGRSGVEGHIDTHFWDRFGAAILMSVVDDSIAIATTNARSNSGGNTVVLPSNTTSAARGAASIVVENNVRISPTLNKNQGEQLSVLVARDLDFKAVYELRRK